MDIRIKTESGKFETINASHVVFANMARIHGYADTHHIYSVIVMLALAGF